ncbi:MAG: MrtC family glutamic-type intramembrane protease [Myxococcota bacterium]|nr:MrtC family glutamic-type intramembrane protease [Myxococcota bacterium]
MDPTRESDTTDPRRVIREVALVYVGVCVATAALGALRAIPAARDAAHLGIAALFLFVPLYLARRSPGGARHYGIDLGGLLEAEPSDDDDRSPGPLGLYDLARTLRRSLPSALRELGAALGVAAIVFPPFVVGFWLWHRPGHSFTWSLPPDLASFALTQIVLVGLPEEALFRGYVQTRLHDALPPRRTILGAPVHVGVLIAQAALFALVHLATEPHPAKLAVFFPGLLFGWMRAWRGGIGAAILFHAMSNVLAEILVRGWL